MSRKKMVDAIDIQILNILQQDGRITSKELSGRINLSEAATHIRLQNLIKRKIISSINAVIDFSKVGFSFRALLQIKVIAPKKQWILDKLKESGKTVLLLQVRKEEQQLTDAVCLYVVVTFKSLQSFKEFAKDLFLSDDDALVYFEYFEISETIIASPNVVLTVDDLK